MNLNDDPRCLCLTDWVDDLGIRNVSVECPLHGLHREEDGSETLVGALHLPENGKAPNEDGLVIVVRRYGRDGIVRESRLDANTAERARTQGRIDELTRRLDRAEAELRAVYETLKIQDGALSAAERLIAEGEELRARYETVTGRHLKVA